MSRKAWIAAAAAAATAALAAAPALADQLFHTSHAALHAVAGAPLRSGFVNDIHTNGAVNSAREEYQLNGAQPDTTYQVQLVIYPSQTCSGAPFLTIPSSTLTTNSVGNGTSSFVFPTGPPNDPPLRVGIVWQLLSATGSAVYATDCVPVAVD
jgi:hypothetical protein